MNELDGVETTDDDPGHLPTAFRDFTFETIRNNGRHNCGVDVNLPTPQRTQDMIAAEVNFVRAPIVIHSDATDERSKNKPDSVHMKKLIEVTLTKNKRVRTEVFERNPDAEVVEANATVESILSWAEAAGLDPLQKRAFECIVASFLLSFCDEAQVVDFENGSVELLDRSRFRTMKLNLNKLKGSAGIQLVCLMHGPGGSGKTTVVNLVMAYSREFCELIGHPFTDRTIVVTAMSGVAATLLHGETLHMATWLNRDRRTVEKELADEWQDTRMLIIDEISFANEDDLVKIYQYTQILKKDKFTPFGGINMVFAGDYSQLEPVKRSPIYQTGHEIPEFHHSLNTFIELDGKHRFKEDPDYGEVMYRMRQGESTEEDINMLNELTISDDRLPPSNVQVACDINADRDAVNTGKSELLGFAVNVNLDLTVFSFISMKLYLKSTVKSISPLTEVFSKGLL